MDQKPNSTVTIGAVRFGNDLPLSLIAGPCALESKSHAFEMAAALKEIAGRAGVGLVYKTSFLVLIRLCRFFLKSATS